MAVDKKISQLTSLAQVDVSASTDVLPIVDTSATETKKITVSALVGAGATAGISGAVLTNGTINSTTIGATTPSTGSFTTLTTSSTVTLNGGSADGVLYLNGSKVATSGSALRFDGTNLGIGTVAALPVAPLSIGDGSVLQFYGVLDAFPSATSDTAAVIGRTGGGGVAPFNNAGSLIYRPRVTATAGRSSHIFYTGSPSAERLRIDESGNVGIGTGSPAYKLDVVGTAKISSTLDVGGDAGIGSSTSSGYAVFGLISPTTGSARYGSIRKNYDSPFDLRIRASNSAVAAPLVFDLSNSTEAARFDTSGNLGLGTTSPNILSWNKATTLNTATGNVAYEVAINGSAQAYFAADASNVYLAAYANKPLLIRTNNATVATFDTSGQLGLGVTPSAWNTTIRAFDFGYSGFAFASSGTTEQVTIGSNWFQNTSSSNRYKNNGYATFYQQINGTHTWYTAPSGTAGNAITFTQVLAVEGGKSLALEGATSQSGTGITFPATQSASSNANTLDDYEEGTWTPTLKNASSSSTFTSNTGRYTKIGRLVYCSFVNDSGNTGTAGSDITLSGLPFAYGGTSNVPTLVAFTANGIPAAVNCYLSRTINGSTSFVVRDAAGNALTNQLTFAAGTIIYEV